MKILVLNYEFPPLGGGYGQYHLLCKKLVERGHEVKYVTSRLPGQPHEEMVDGINVIRVLSFRQNRESATFFEMSSYLISSAVQLSEIISDFNPDLCHTFFGVPTGALIFHPSLSDIPTVLTCLGSDVPHHNPDDYKLLYNALTPVVRKIWDNYDTVVANSEGLKKEIQQISPSQRVNVICNGIDTDQFKPGQTTQNSPFKLLFVGRLINLKRVDRAIKLTEKLNQRSQYTFHLDIVGEGKERSRLAELAQEKQIEEFVTFHGYVSHGEISEVYQNADFYIQLSKVEGMSNTIMEAMASGTIPVVSDVGGTNELIDESVGRVVQGKIDNTDIRYLAEVADDTIDMQAKKAHARERIVSEFGSDQLARSYEKCYSSLITTEQQ